MFEVGVTYKNFLSEVTFARTVVCFLVIYTLDVGA